VSVPLRGLIAGAALIVVLVAAALLLAQAAGIGRNPTAMGVVIKVDASSAVEVTGFTLRGSDGSLTPFRIGVLESGGAAFPAVHLREHLASLLPIVVTYHVEGADRVATRLEDEPLPSTTG
jgi:hypothetical protein